MTLSTLEHLELVTENMEVIPVPAAAVKEFDYTIKDFDKENLIASTVHIVIDVAILFEALKADDSKASIYEVMLDDCELTRDLLDRILLRNDIALIEDHKLDQTKVEFYPIWSDLEEFEEENPYQFSEIKDGLLTIHVEKDESIDTE